MRKNFKEPEPQLTILTGYFRCMTLSMLKLFGMDVPSPRYFQQELQCICSFPHYFQGPAPLQLPRPVYTPEETHIYSQMYEVYNLTLRPGEDFMRRNSGLLSRTFLYYPVPMRFLEFRWQQLPNGQMIQGVVLPKSISGDFFKHGLGMINFHMHMRSCICFTSWGIWMNLQDHLQQGRGAQLPDYLNDVMCYVLLVTIGSWNF